MRVAALAAGLAVTIAVIYWHGARFREARPKAQYVNPAVCAGCHHAIYKSYSRSGMGRSFSSLTGGLASDVQFVHQPSDRVYRVFERGGSLYQQRHQLGPDGETMNVFAKRADYVIGSGNHARSFLYRGGEGKLYQMPLTWYAERGGFWAMSPGYDRPQHSGFRRSIPYDCLFCHTGYPPQDRLPAVTAGTDAVFPRDLPDGIDCQRRHGPGGAHVRAASEKKPAEVIRRAIVNPRRLGRDRQLEICMQCHLETSSRPLPYAIVRFDRNVFSYRPGEPLGNHMFHFDHAPGTGPADKFEIAHAAYRLRSSACFQKSATLTCTTCHDPHRPSGGPEASSRYNQACMGCHSAAHRQAEDCASCHMPKRRTDDVVHALMTDHRIQRDKPGRDLLAPIPERAETPETAYRGEVVAYYPAEGVDELYVAVAQVMDGSNLRNGIPRLESAIRKHAPANAQFYFELAEAYWKSGDAARAILQYEEALKRRPSHRTAIRNLGVALRSRGELARAASVLRAAGDDSVALVTLGDVELSLRELHQAEASLRRALELDPDSPEAHNNLGRLMAEKGADAGAMESYRRALAVRPDYPAAHNNLANRLVAAGRHDDAVYHFQQAIRHDPAYAEAHFNFGVALAAREDWAAAQRLLAKAAELDPSLAEAWNNLGLALAAQGLTARAAEQFQRAVQERPQFHAARLNLAIALANLGRRLEAIAQAERVARGGAPESQIAARRLLSQLQAP